MKQLLTLSLIICSISISAQNKISFNGKTFGRCEVVEAAVSDESLTVEVFEINLEKFDTDRYGSALPASYGLTIEVNDPNGISFPIKAEQSISYDLSDIQYQLTEAAHNDEQMAKIDQGKLAEEKAEMEKAKPSIDERAKEISQLLMDGKISPDEAAKRIEALSEESMEIMDYSTKSINSLEYLEDQAQFSIRFYDTKENVETILYSGKVMIKRFSKSTVEIIFSGIGITECMSARKASSKEANSKCTYVESKYLPATKVLSEGPVEGYLLVNVKEFQDNR